MKKIILILFMLAGVQVIHSHKLHENADQFYYGLWKTEANSHIQMEIEIWPKKKSKIVINGLEVKSHRYYFADTSIGRGMPIFVWSNDEETIHYRLYFISGGEHNKEYAVGFYSLAYDDGEGASLGEKWHDIRLLKVRDNKE